MSLKRRIVGLVAAVAMLAGCLSFGGCADKRDPKLAAYDADETKVPLDTTTLAEEVSQDISVYPRAEGRSQKQINWIDLTDCSEKDLFLAEGLQGIVNRKDPSLYLCRNYFVQGVPGFNAPKYWLDNLDVSYFEEDGETPYFEKTEYATLFELVALYRDKLEGAVLYHERLAVHEPMANQFENAGIYGDMAVANLTSMMCAQYDALPLTDGQLADLNAYLKSEGKAELKVLADTRDFMKDKEGNLSGRGDRDVWMNCYEYVFEQMSAGKWKISDECISHNGTFNLANYDYAIAHKMFLYNRILFKDATDEEKAMEDRILAVTKDHTPVIGVWHLDGDEEIFVMNVNNHGKFFLVTFETWNASWTSGLDRVVPTSKQEEKLTYDSSKIYIAMTFSETDNNSFTNYKFPTLYESEYRGKFPMTWALNQGGMDLNPNIVQYVNATMKPGDGFATGESGIGYIRNPAVVEQYKSGFFARSDLYAERIGNGCIRTLLNNKLGAMDYCMYMKNVESVLSGYGAGYEGTNEYLGQNNNFYFHDTPVFQQISEALTPQILLDIEPSADNFYSVGLFGWQSDLRQVWDSVKNFPSNYVFVTQKQLADLYTQKMSAEFNDVKSAEFKTAMTVDELGYLYYSDNFANYTEALIEGQESYRFGSAENYSIYKFDLDESVKSAKFNLSLAGEYVVKVSSDLEHWTAVGLNEIDSNKIEKSTAVFDLPEGMAGKPVYLKISDPTTEDGVGFRFFGLSMTTDQTALERAVTFGTDDDGAYYVSGGTVGEDGYRTGEIVYNLPVSKQFSAANLTVEADSKVEISFSADGSDWFSRPVSEIDRSAYSEMGSLYTAYLDGTSETMKVKIKCDSAIRTVRLSLVSSYDEFVFSPCGNELDRENLVTGWECVRTSEGVGANCKVSNTSVLTYAFRLDSNNTAPMLEVLGGGLFKLEISSNGTDWTTLKAVEKGENITDALVFDISAQAKPDGVFYLRFGKSTDVGSTAVLYQLKLINSND